MTPRVLVSTLCLSLAAVAAALLTARAQTAPQQATVQTPPRDVRPGAQAGTAVIRGRILAADTGRPLRRAQVRMTAPELGRDNRTISTDEDGRYEVTDLPAGRYTVNVTRSGYLPLRYGQRRPLEQGKPLQILDTDIVENVDFALPKMSLITGHVTDELGEPIAGVSMYAMRMMYLNGRQQLVPVNGDFARTDDAGDYRIVGLPPGTYIVQAKTNDKWTVDAGGREETMGYAPTYFPGTTNAPDARRITIGLGKEASNTDFALIPGRAATVSGTAFDSRGRPFDTVNLAQEVRGLNFGSFRTAGDAKVLPDGTFSIVNVAPGEYKLGAQRPGTPGSAGDAEVAIVPITVNGFDVENVAVTGSAGGSIIGKVIADEGVTARIPKVGVSVAERLLGQADPMLLGVYRTPGIAQVSDENTFAIAGVFGPARFAFTLPEGWRVKAVQHDGRDIIDLPIDPKSGEVMSGVEVVVTDRITTVTGRLSDETNAPVADGTVVVFSTDDTKWFEGSRFVRGSRPDQQGRFQIKGLPPGEYFAVAMDFVEEDTWNDPEYLRSLQNAAQKIRLVDGESQALALRLVTP